MAVPAVPVEGDVVTLKVGDATPTVVSGMLTLCTGWPPRCCWRSTVDAYHQ